MKIQEEGEMIQLQAKDQEGMPGATKRGKEQIFP